MSKKDFVKCEVCERDKKISEYYTSDNPNHKYGCITICKKCASNMIDMDNVETLKTFLKKVDRPFILSLYKSAIESKRKNKVGAYFSNIGMPNTRHLSWDDSEGVKEALKENYKDMFKTEDEIKEEKRQEKKDALQEELDELGMTKEQLEEYKVFWGNGYTPYEYDSFQKRYDSLIDNYPNKTALHIENLKTYVVYKIKSEHLVASNNPDPNQIKLYTDLAIKQATMAKLNLDKLSASDLSQNLNSISEIAILVEKHVDIIPILPKFIAKPNDPIDVAILSIINYNRRMKGLEDAEHSDVYNFYQERLREFKDNENTDEVVKKNIIEKEIVTESGKRKTILFYDVYKVVEERKKEFPNDKFIQNLEKWVDFVSYMRFFPDAFYQMMEKEDTQIRLSSDQKMILRICSRFPHSYLVFPRGNNKASYVAKVA